MTVNMVEEKSREIPDEREDISLDPEDWEQFRISAHAALDHAIDYIRSAAARPIWAPVPNTVRGSLTEPLPTAPTAFDEVYEQFRRDILPYATGNIHPRFFGWVHGAGTASAIVTEMMAAAMNSNCGGRDHGAIYVEREVIEWCRQIFGFPEGSSGLLVSGTSMANLIGLTVARNALPDADIRARGVRELPAGLTAYVSAESHESVTRAAEILGLGRSCLRQIPVSSDLTMDADQLANAIAADRRAGLRPFCVIGTAGSVNTAAIDPLTTIARICEAENLWFHVDGAFAALAYMSDSLRPRLKGMELADSLAFDFHKWAQVQYDAGCILVRRGDLHRAAFSMRPPYLTHAARGLAGGGFWPCEFGPELSRSFRALKIWFAIKEHGIRKLSRVIEQNCRQASYLADLIERDPDFELLAPAPLNIVCFRFYDEDLDDTTLNVLNDEIVADVQEAGIAAPSTTRIAGNLAIRVNITNHRTRRRDLDVLIDALRAAAQRRLTSAQAQNA